MLFVFAGKAHPADEPGKELIRSDQRRSARMPEFEGRVRCSWRATTCGSRAGWSRAWTCGSTTRSIPLEASGTSGMKAGINGVINLSVLDGWWGEGYDGDNGWAIKPASETLADDAPQRWRRAARSTSCCRTR